MVEFKKQPTAEVEAVKSKGSDKLSDKNPQLDSSVTIEDIETYMYELAIEKMTQMTGEQLAGLRNKKGSFQLVTVPSMIKIVSFGFKKAIKFLRFCPLSPYFGEIKSVMYGQFKNAA